MRFLLQKALGHIPSPPLLTQALHHAVFSGGGRLRPLLTLAVADALGARRVAAARQAATAVELLHCASLVHDDLPCFDNSDMRRHKPSVQRLYGERLAVLTGDGLIAAAFGALAPVPADACAQALTTSTAMLQEVHRAACLLVSGQSLECETDPDLEAYHSAKTGALFEAAAVTGAQAAGVDTTPWRTLGYNIGRAYQLADDLQDGKKDGQQPNAANGQSLWHVRGRIMTFLVAAKRAVGATQNAPALTHWFDHFQRRIALQAPAPAPGHSTMAPA